MSVAAMARPVMAAHGLKPHRITELSGVSKPVTWPPNPSFTLPFKAGPQIAVSYLSIGGRAVSAVAKPGRGGARNFRDRTTDVLTARQLANLVAASEHAALIGLPFTRMFSVHWQAAGVDPSNVVAATGRFLDMLTKLLRRRGSATAWLWVQENGDGKGAHVHVLAHVPTSLSRHVARSQIGWLRRITGERYRARVIHSRPIGGRMGDELGDPAHYAANLGKALSYVLKGTTAETAGALELPRHDGGGRCVGKRCGTSQNTGRKARETRAS